MSLNKTATPFETKLKAVKAYLRTGQSLRKVAGDFGIPYATLGFWVKQYQKGGIESLKTRKVAKRKVSKATEVTVMMLREQHPALNIAAAQRMLKKQGISMSNNGIWQIWKRYGITKRSMHEQIHTLGPATPESRRGIVQAKAFIQKKNFKAAARVLNALPCLSEGTILKQVPENLLSPRRRLDRLPVEFGTTLFPEFRNKARRIGAQLERQGFVYSSIFANFFELFALQNMGKPEEQRAVLVKLEKKLYGVKDSVLWFHYYTHAVLAYYDALEIPQALTFLKKCRQLSHRLPTPNCWDMMSALFGTMGYHKEAHMYAMRAYRNIEDPAIRARLALRIAIFGLLAKGNYDEAKKMLSKAAEVKHKQGLNAMFYIGRAFIAFGQGNLDDATRFFREALEKSYRGELYNRLYATSVGLASIAMALNKKGEAHTHLRKYLPLMKKHNLQRELVSLKFLLRDEKRFPNEMDQLPAFHLFNLLARAHETGAVGDYRTAIAFARRHHLIGLVQRMIVFLPESVVQVLAQGKQTGLPRALMRFPVFNQAVPVYHVRFLGDVMITKNQQQVRSHLRPKERAFVTHLAMRAPAADRSILLDDLCRNFWTESGKPVDRLLHMLASIKNQLKIPRHLLAISSTAREPQLSNRGVYFTTDYNEFEILLTQAKSLERAGEWHFAKRDYVKAFTLLRGRPFEKMYDQWSEDMRNAILNRVENDGVRFVRKCLESNCKKEARKVLEKVGRITDSQEVQELSQEINA